MKKKMIATLFTTVLMAVAITGCGNSKAGTSTNITTTEETTGSTQEVVVVGAEEESFYPAITLQFGYDGPVYTANLEENDTATLLARYVSQGEYNLPIYTYENYENEDVLQFYDIPSRYEIPSEPEHITEEKAGEIYYSSPNRVILFYQDANVEGDYTKIGEIEDKEGLAESVQNNEPLVDWNCLVIPVRVVE